MSGSQWVKRPVIETTNVFSPTIGVTVNSTNRMTVNKDLCLPILQKIQQQNISLKKQMETIANQLEKLQSFSKSITQQNSRLRSHYYQRNDDVRKLLQTIKVNLSTQISDIKHQMYLLRQGNCFLFKNIESQMNLLKQFSARINEMQRNYQNLKKNNIEMQQRVLNPLKGRLQNNLNSKHALKIQQKLQILTLSQEKLQKQIAQLVYQIGRIQKQNRTTIIHTTNQKNQNQNEKHYLKNNIIQCLKSMNELKNNLENQKAIEKTDNQMLTQLKLNLEQMVRKRQEKNIEKQQKLSKLVILKSSKQYQNEKIMKAKTSISETQILILKKNQQKQNIQKQLMKKYKQIQNSTANTQQKKKQMTNTAMQEIKQIKQKTLQVQLKCEDEKQQISRQIKQSFNLLQHLQLQLKELTRDQQQYAQICSKFTNPVQQIQRAELKLGLKEKKRKQSASIF